MTSADQEFPQRRGEESVVCGNVGFGDSRFCRRRTEGCAVGEKGVGRA